MTTGEGVTQWTLDHDGGTQVSLGGSQESVMREREWGQEGALGRGCHYSCWFVLEGKDPVLLIFASFGIWHGVRLYSL